MGAGGRWARVGWGWLFPDEESSHAGVGVFFFRGLQLRLVLLRVMRSLAWGC